MDTLLLEMINAIKAASPEIWRIVTAQVLVEATQFLIGGGVSLIIFIVLVVIALININRMGVFPGVFSILPLGISVVCFIAYYGRVTNPEFYALQYILLSIKP
jgi:hypothetical protein